MSDWEVYPNAPLALVAVEVRLPSEAAGAALSVPAQRAFRDRLGDDAWVIESVPQQEHEMTFGPAGPISHTMRTTPLSRFTVRDRTSAVTVSSTSILIETTNYDGYPRFRPVLELVLSATDALLGPDGVARVGMRYIDEIRVSDIAQGPGEWNNWLCGSLLPPRPACLEELSLSVAGWNGVVQYTSGPERALVVRYGPQVGQAVNPAGPLRRPRTVETGPYFLLDLDSFWQPTGIPVFAPAVLLEMCDELHAPIHAIFESFITDDLRAIFRAG